MEKNKTRKSDNECYRLGRILILNQVVREGTSKQRPEEGEGESHK